MKKQYIPVVMETVVLEREEIVRTSLQEPQDHVIFDDCFD